MQILSFIFLLVYVYFFINIQIFIAREDKIRKDCDSHGEYIIVSFAFLFFGLFIHFAILKYEK